jgi:hypothetical protein
MGTIAPLVHTKRVEAVVNVVGLLYSISHLDAVMGYLDGHGG